MQNSLETKLRQFIVELEHIEATTMYVVPEVIMKALRRAKQSEKLLHGIFAQVSGSGGVELNAVIRREFGVNEELMDRFKQWASHSKEQFEDALHDAVDRAEIRAGNQGIFFEGTPTKNESAEALQLLKNIAHAAVICQFHANQEQPEPYVRILDNLLQFYALPNTYPEASTVNYRNLISADRLHEMSGGVDTITNAMKEFAKLWYQQSQHNFLESKEGYFSYNDVQHFIYALTEQQQERLGNDYYEYIEDEFKLARAKKDLDRAKYLLAMLDTISTWLPPTLLQTTKTTDKTSATPRK